MFEEELLASVVDLAVAYAVLHVVKCQSGHGGTWCKYFQLVSKMPTSHIPRVQRYHNNYKTETL